MITNRKQKATITSFDQLDLNATYTYVDYLSWQFNEKVELIMGKIFKMPPAPNSYHQEILMNLGSLIHKYLKKRSVKFILLLSMSVYQIPI